MKATNTLTELLEASRELRRYCVTTTGMPDKNKGRTPEQQTAIDDFSAAIAKAEGKTT